MGAPVVYDVNVLVGALVSNKSEFMTWPRLPSRTENPAADCIGVVNDNHEFSLWVSPHILRNTRRVLVDYYGIDAADADQYIEILEEIAVESGGGVIDPPRTVHACDDHEDNLVLDLAAASSAVLIVSDDTDLTSMSPWRGTPILRPHEFAGRVDVSRRKAVGKPVGKSITELAAERQQREADEDFDLDTTEEGFVLSEFQERRDKFSTDLDRLRTVVDRWDPQRQNMPERIALWRKNIEALNRRVTQVDSIVDTAPETADSALTELAAKLGVALDRLDPQQPTPIRKLRRRPETASPGSPEAPGAEPEL